LPLVSERWAILRLESLTPLTVVEYRDHRGGLPRLSGGPPGLAPVLPDAMGLAALLAELGQGRSPRTGRPPVFLDAHPSLAALDLDGFFSPALSGQPSARLTGAEWLPRSPFTLPLRVVAVGEEADGWVAELLEQSWFQGEEVRRHGLDLHVAPRDVEPLIHAVRPHVVVTGDPTAALGVASALPEPHRPRLILWIDPTLASPAPAAPPADVAGVALLRVGAAEPILVGRIVTTVFTEFAHDLPLHEIADNARGVTPGSIRLTADPFSLQSLRLSEALQQLRREGRRWEMLLPAPPPGMAQPWIAQSREAVTFLGESHGFAPMARTRAALDTARAGFEVARVQALATRQAIREMRVRPPVRAVQVALERLETSPYLEAMEPSSSLAAGTAYQVRVHVGMRLPDSLVETDTPIEPLLGPADDEAGHRLEVAIQGKDFQILSERTVPLFLPREGNSEPAYFEVRAPERPGPAELRICVYHRNHLIQSFRLDALVEPSEQPHANETVLRVRLELSRAENFVDLDELGPRTLSIGLNRAARGGTHDFILKGTGGSDELSLPATTFQQSADELRRVLERAARDPLNPALMRDYPTLAAGAPVTPDVAAIVRELAEWGHALYDAFFDRAARPGGPLRPHLVALRSSGRERIQVIRFEYADAFPWPLLHDWDLPADPAADVCLGWQPDATGAVVRCGHASGAGLYCVRGFWGVRHRVEELIQERGGSVTAVSPPAQGPPVRLVADAGLPESASLAGDLAADLGADLATGPVQAATLLDLLFQKPDERPALLILLGHHDRQVRPGGRGVSRIQIDSPLGWLSETDVRGRAQNEPAAWSQPRSAILLMACSSANTGIETLTDFVTAWTVSGASAIVGTECVIGSKLAAAFARSFARLAWKTKVSLGEAMADIRADLLAHGNPLAFLFHAIGDVDLVLQ
jgi:hypothetical protein